MTVKDLASFPSTGTNDQPPMKRFIRMTNIDAPVVTFDQSDSTDGPWEPLTCHWPPVTADELRIFSFIEAEVRRERLRGRTARIHARRDASPGHGPIGRRVDPRDAAGTQQCHANGVVHAGIAAVAKGNSTRRPDAADS